MKMESVSNAQGSPKDIKGFSVDLTVVIEDRKFWKMELAKIVQISQSFRKTVQNANKQNVVLMRQLKRMVFANNVNNIKENLRMAKAVSKMNVKKMKNFSKMADVNSVLIITEFQTLRFSVLRTSETPYLSGHAD